MFRVRWAHTGFGEVVVIPVEVLWLDPKTVLAELALEVSGNPVILGLFGELLAVGNHPEGQWPHAHHVDDPGLQGHPLTRAGCYFFYLPKGPLLVLNLP